MNRHSPWPSIIGYQAVWVLAVWQAGAGRWWPAWLAMLAFALWQFVRGPAGHAEWLLMPVAALAGALIDSIQAASGLVHYAASLPSAHLAPLWIIAIWLAFSLTLRPTFGFLRGHPWWAALLGAVGAPLAYNSAAGGWHAVQFPDGRWPASALIAVLWALAFPALIGLVSKLERDHHTLPEPEHG
ncbi:DUF2878 domain-containing protein [Oleiagrimonas sp. C23AA]|uniref:DUF2878 domain-containing protein n=1 Tax=Oleiagrimonas sp. C23AA TaxID=2719047 RepID=UPI0014219F6B|nr:DUF2878 domain-containing protein [Oleiagrimonas sp. C23AA]NII11715.1 DUF2878 domain-containing protein [Oleiagrimonas sp. C23AA]